MTGPVDRGPGQGGLVYSWPGPEPAPFVVPSVTTVLAAVTPSRGLVTWAARQVAIAAVRMAPTMAERAATDPDGLTRDLARTADRVRDAAGDLGTRVHDAVATGMDPDAADPDLARHLRALRAWAEREHVEVVAAERTAWAPPGPDREAGWAGTLDAILRVGGRLYVVDYKTGRTLLPAKVALQLTAYATADYIGEAGVRDPAATRLLGRLDGALVIHLRPELPHGLAVYRLPIDPAAWARAVGLFTWYQSARLLPGGITPEEGESMNESAMLRAADALRTAADALADAVRPDAPRALPGSGRLHEGDRHEPSHNPLRANRRGLFCPTRLDDGEWCDWAAPAA